MCSLVRTGKSETMMSLGFASVTKGDIRLLLVIKVISQIFPVGKESGSIQLCGELCDPRSLSYCTAFIVLYVVILRPAIPGWHQTFYKLRMTLNSGSSCLYLLSAVIIDIYGHAWFMGCWVSRDKGLCMLGKYTIN